MAIRSIELGERMDNVGCEILGANFARTILRRLPEFGVSLPGDTKYLAIGAGRAKPELEFARGLGIRSQNITLLDWRFSQQARARFQEIGFSGITIENDMYQFLETPTKEKYDVISLFGMDHVLDDKNLERLIAGLSAKMNPHGIAVIVPYEEAKETHMWNRYGFTSLEIAKDPYSYLMSFTNPSANI